MGYLHPVKEGLLEQLGVALDGRGNVKADTSRYQTSDPKVFAAGDMRRGQSLVVWAIREGRQAARAVDEYLMGSSDLPR
jgi:glutamate synthase (NADPH/NADH) small chain